MVQEKLSFWGELCRRLSVIPGLKFLDDYQTRIKGQYTQTNQVVDDYVGYAKTAKGAAKDAKGELSKKNK